MNTKPAKVTGIVAIVAGDRLHPRRWGDVGV